jgi:hypothetical protein
MRYLTLLGWLSIFVLSSAWPCRAVEQTEAPVAALVIQPATIELPRFVHDAVGQAIIIARTTVGAVVPADLHLSFTSSPGIEITLGKWNGAAGDITWPVSVRVTGDAPDDGTADFRLVYDIAPDGNASQGSGTRLQRAQLAVKVQPSRVVSPVDDAELSIKGDSAVISEGRPVTTYLLIRNKSNYPFKAETLLFDKPKFLTVTAALAETEVKLHEVKPHETWRVPLVIQIAQLEREQIGEWLILANVTLTRGEGSFERKDSGVVDYKVNVGVPGVSDVLKVLDLPSLLLVPGALVLATWSLLFGGSAADQRKWLEWKTTSFWLVSITISIIIFLALWATGKWVSFVPDFLVAFGVGDVAFLWLGCVGGGVVTFMVYWGWVCYRARRREPLSTDEPIDILRKLGRANLPFYLPILKRTGEEQEIFKLSFTAPSGKAWTIPKMLLQRLVSDQRAGNLIGEVNRANNRQADGLPDLIRALQRGLRRKFLVGPRRVSLKWNAGSLSRPELLSVNELSSAGDPISPIRYA